MISIVAPCNRIALLMISIVVQCNRNELAMLWNEFAHDKHSCAIQSNYNSNALELN